MNDELADRITLAQLRYGLSDDQAAGLTRCVGDGSLYVTPAGEVRPANTEAEMVLSLERIVRQIEES